MTYITTLVLLISTTITATALEKSEPYAIVSDQGVVNFFHNDQPIGNIKISVRSEGGAYVDQSSATMTWDQTDNHLYRHFSGVLEIPSTGGKKLEFTSGVVGTKKTGLTLGYQFYFPDAARLGSYQISFFMDVGTYKGAKIILSGDQEPVAVVVPQRLEQTQLGRKTSVLRIQVAPSEPYGFILESAGRCPPRITVSVLDNRLQGSASIELRINLHRKVGDTVAAGTKKTQGVRLTYNRPLAIIYDKNALDESEHRR